MADKDDEKTRVSPEPVDTTRTFASQACAAIGYPGRGRGQKHLDLQVPQAPLEVMTDEEAMKMYTEVAAQARVRAEKGGYANREPTSDEQADLIGYLAGFCKGMYDLNPAKPVMTVNALSLIEGYNCGLENLQKSRRKK